MSSDEASSVHSGSFHATTGHVLGTGVGGHAEPSKHETAARKGSAASVYNFKKVVVSQGPDGV